MTLMIMIVVMIMMVRIITAIMFSNNMKNISEVFDASTVVKGN